jgi:hypothetical protein
MQLSIEVPVLNENLFEQAKKEYEKSNVHNKYLVFNRATGVYFVSYFFSKETIEKYSNFKIVI